MALIVASSGSNPPLGEQLARLPGLVRNRLEDSPWWLIPGVPPRDAWLAIRGPLAAASDLEILRQLLELMARVNAVSVDLLDRGTIDPSEWDSLQQCLRDLLEHPATTELPADFQLSRIAAALWGAAPWPFWDESLQAAGLAQRAIAGDGEFNRDRTHLTLGLALRDLGWTLVYRRLNSPGRARVMEEHPAVAAALLNAIPSSSRVTIDVVEQHHRFTQATRFGIRDRYPRASMIGLLGSTLTRLVELETALIPSGASGATIRRTALATLATEVQPQTTAADCVERIATCLAGTSARAHLLVPAARGRADRHTLHSAETGVPASHTALRNPLAAGVAARTQAVAATGETSP